MAFYGFANGTCHHTLNLASIAWVMYSPAHDLVSSGAVFIGPATNNIVEYEVVIGLLTDAASWDITWFVSFHGLIVSVLSVEPSLYHQKSYTVMSLSEGTSIGKVIWGYYV